MIQFLNIILVDTLLPKFKYFQECHDKAVLLMELQLYCSLDLTMCQKVVISQMFLQFQEKIKSDGATSGLYGVWAKTM
jgi:hypothetical protein